MYKLNLPETEYMAKQSIFLNAVISISNVSLCESDETEYIYKNNIIIYKRWIQTATSMLMIKIYLYDNIDIFKGTLIMIRVMRVVVFLMLSGYLPSYKIM